MTVWKLEGYNTDSRHNDVRYRAYTTSQKKAELFKKIPKIRFTDSGHGIVFSAFEAKGPRLPTISTLADYVSEEMAKLAPKPVPKQSRAALLEELSRLKAADEFWKAAYEGVPLTGEQVRAELSDLAFLIEQIPLVYDHITGGRLSKTNYKASIVIAEHDEHVQRLIDEEVKDRTEELQAEFSRLKAETADNGDRSGHDLPEALREFMADRGRLLAYGDADLIREAIVQLSRLKAGEGELEKVARALRDELGFAEWASAEDAQTILRNLIDGYTDRLAAALPPAPGGRSDG